LLVTQQAIFSATISDIIGFYLSAEIVSRPNRVPKFKEY